MSAKNSDTGKKVKPVPWQAETTPQRMTIAGRVTFAPRRFMHKFMGNSIRMYGTLMMISQGLVAGVRRRTK